MPKSKKVKQINPNKESGGKQPYQQNRIYDTEGLAPALCANKSDLLIVEKRRIKHLGNLYNQTTRWGVYDKNGISPCIMGGGHIPMIQEDMKNKIIDQKAMVEIFPADYRSDEGIRIRENGKAPTLTRGAGGTKYNSLAIIGPRIRRLTPLECERLQTIADNYTNYVSDSQRYKMLGNGWTVDVIAHIFSHLKTQK